MAEGSQKVKRKGKEKRIIKKKAPSAFHPMVLVVINDHCLDLWGKKRTQ